MSSSAKVFLLAISLGVSLQPAQVRQTQIQPKVKTGLCEIRGTIRGVSPYAQVMITINDSHTKFLPVNIIIPPGTQEQHYSIPVPCNNDANAWYNLFFHYQKQIGIELNHQYSPGKEISGGGYGKTVIVKGDKPVYTVGVIDLGQWRNSGILLEEMRTDRDTYAFGDVVQLIVRTTIKGLGAATEEADYTVTVSCGGISLIVKQDKMTVQAGQQTTVQLPIHHTFYSRGVNDILLRVQTSEYDFSCRKTVRIG
jgi:hypothetical protein